MLLLLLLVVVVVVVVLQINYLLKNKPIWQIINRINRPILIVLVNLFHRMLEKIKKKLLNKKNEREKECKKRNNTDFVLIYN